VIYADHTLAHATGQIIIAIYFIWMGIKNIKLWDMNIHRIAVQSLPAIPCLLFGFTIQFSGAFLVLSDWQTEIGAGLLILFTILSTGLHHRFWQMADPMVRTYHFLLLTNNLCITGGLLLLI
jgi:transmembrane protein